MVEKKWRTAVNPASFKIAIAARVDAVVNRDGSVVGVVGW
jgi:hypothetical protein